MRDAQSSYWLARFLFLRCLGFIYCIAFLCLIQQAIPLIGENGILPAGQYLEYLRGFADVTGESPYLRRPTVFWLGHSDAVLIALAYVGLVLALLLLFGVSNAILVGVLWVLYLSFTHIGQLFYGYGWELLLLEAFLEWTREQ